MEIKIGRCNWCGEGGKVVNILNKSLCEDCINLAKDMFRTCSVQEPTMITSVHFMRVEDAKKLIESEGLKWLGDDSQFLEKYKSLILHQP
jgi:hypothetical protein